MSDDVQRIIDITARTEGVDEATNSTNKLADGMDNVVQASDKVSKSTQSVERAYESLQKRVDESYRSTQQITVAQKTLDDARAQGLVTDTRYADLQDLIAKRYTAATAGANAHSAAMGGLSAQGMAAAHAIRTGIEELALGVPVTTVAAQQMSHLSFAASGPGGLTGAFSEAAGMFGRLATSAAQFLTPAVVTTGAVAAIGAAALIAGQQWNAAQTEIEKALLGIGKVSGATVDDVNRAAANAALATGASFASAREAATALVETGQVGKDALSGLTTVTEKYAKATGADSVAATKLLAQAFADPVKGADELNKQYGFLDLTTQNLIKASAELGDKQSAQLTLAQAFEPTLDKLIQKNKDWETTWGSIKALSSDVFSMLGDQGSKLFGGGTDQQQLNALQARRANIVAPGPTSSPSEVGGGRQLDELNQQIAELERRIKAASDAARNAAIDQLGLQADKVASSLIPAEAQLEKTRTAIELLQRAKNNGTGGPLVDPGLTQLRNQEQLLEQSIASTVRYQSYVQQVSQAWSGVGQQTAITLQHLQNQLPVSQAVGSGAKMVAQYYATIAELTPKVKDQQEAITIAAKQYQAAQADAISEATLQTQALHDQNDLSKATTLEQQKQVAGAQAYRQVLDATKDAQIALNRQLEVEESYNIKIKAAREQARQAASDEQQAMLGVTQASQQAAAAAQDQANAMEAAARAAQDARNALETSQSQQGIGAGGGGVSPEGEPQFGGFSTGDGAFTSTSNLGSALLAGYKLLPSTQQQLTLSLASGGLLGAFVGVQNTPNTSDYNARFGLSLPDKATTDTTTTATKSLVDAIVNTTSGQSAQLAVLQQLMAQEQQIFASSTGDKQIVALNVIGDLGQRIETLTGQLGNNSNALTDNTSALNDVANVLPGILSSLYAGGQVKGFGFADGGIMTKYGPLPLRAYGGGGIVNSPQIFAAGENYEAEAIIPLQHGAVPVHLSGSAGSGSNVSNVFAPTVNIVIAPGGDSSAGVQMAARSAAEDLISMMRGFSNS